MVLSNSSLKTTSSATVVLGFWYTSFIFNVISSDGIMSTRVVSYVIVAIALQLYWTETFFDVQHCAAYPFALRRLVYTGSSETFKAYFGLPVFVNHAPP